MIRAIAFDNDPAALEVIKEYCDRVGYISLLKTFTSPIEATRYMNNYPVDLIFMDINSSATPGLNLRSIAHRDTMVIYATAHAEFAIEAFNQNALDYLLKPFSFERFLQAAEKAKAYYRFIHQNASRSQQDISLRVDYALMKIPLSKIIYIEGMDDYIRIYLHDQKPVITRMTMKALEQKLPMHEFARVHRSYIVQVNKISFVRNKVVYIDKFEIPVGICYEQKFYAAINNVSNRISA